MKDTIKIDKKNVKLVAHRGLSGLEKENTAASFVAAGNRSSYFGIETDIHLTKDGKFVIIHDFDLKRNAGADVKVEETNFDDLQKIVMTNWYGKAPRTDLRTPALEDYLEICEHYGKRAVLELKTDFTEENLEKLAEIVKSYNMLENTIFISFVDVALVKLRKILPEQPIQFLTCECSDKVVEFLEKYNFGIDILYPNLSKDQIKMLKEKNIDVNIWTCDKKEDAEKYIEWGVDYITTNILE